MRVSQPWGRGGAAAGRPGPLPRQKKRERKKTNRKRKIDRYKEMSGVRMGKWLQAVPTFILANFRHLIKQLLNRDNSRLLQLLCYIGDKVK